MATYLLLGAAWLLVLLTVGVVVATLTDAAVDWILKQVTR